MSSKAGRANRKQVKYTKVYEANNKCHIVFSPPTCFLLAFPGSTKADRRDGDRKTTFRAARFVQ